MQVTAAIVGPGPTDFTMKQLTLDAPRADEILVAIKAVGVCHTDLVGQQGAFGFDVPAVLGHEGAGVVEQVGSEVTAFAPGDRVAISFRSCGHCRKCTDGHPSYCHSLYQLNFIGQREDGSRALHDRDCDVASNFFGQSSFASHALTYARNLVKLPEDVSFAVAAPFGCGIQTGAGSVLNALSCPPGSSLLIAGGGTVGLSAVLAARIARCGAIIVVEPHAARRDLAREFGATHLIDPRETPDLASAVRQILPIGVEYALDTTGLADVLAGIMSSLSPQGTLGCVGIPAPGTSAPGDLTSMITFGHKVMGIIEGDSDPGHFLPVLFDHYRAGRLPVDRMIATYPLAKINEAIADQHAGRCTKIVLTIE